MRVHDIIERLRANADVFDALTRGVSEEQARWRPASDKWSILEVVNHLADEEVEDFRHRIDLALHRPGEPWPPIDPEVWARERQYNSRELGQSVEGTVLELVDVDGRGEVVRTNRLEILFSGSAITTETSIT